jgi:hypothetical protein
MTVSPSSFSKQPDEIYTIEVKFEKRLDTGEAITDHAVTGYSNGTDVTDTIIDGSTQVGTSIFVGVKSGTSGVEYKITVIVTTDKTTPDSNYHEYEADIIMAVEAI